MIAVVVVALPCWAMERRFRFQRLAEYHRSKLAESVTHDLHLTSDGQWTYLFDSDGRPVSIASQDWHALMESKYRRAAAYPWFPISPDPPAPK